MRDLSVDLETLGTGADAPIVSIGATVFDLETGELGETFYKVIELDSALRGRVVDGSTLAWWLIQSDGARLAIAKPAIHEQMHMAKALCQLGDFYLENEIRRVWGNGSSFDVSILEHAYRQNAIAIPWSYSAPRDLRTLVEAAVATGFDPGYLPFEGVEHRADHDAMYQARKISAAWRWIKGLKGQG